jgi:CheY-like chemotaxis protein
VEQNETFVYDLDAPRAAAARTLRILIVDDDHDTVLSLVMLLRCDGHEVRALYHGGEAVPVVEQFEPEVVLIDIGLPDVDGYEVARALRARYGRACPVLIAVTGRNEPEDRQRSLGAGFDHHLPKPYNPEVLLRLMGSRWLQA